MGRFAAPRSVTNNKLQVVRRRTCLVAELVLVACRHLLGFSLGSQDVRGLDAAQLS